MSGPKWPATRSRRRRVLENCSIFGSAPGRDCAPAGQAALAERAVITALRERKKIMAERKGFEPLRACAQHAFQACALNRSANAPSSHPCRCGEPAGAAGTIAIWGRRARPNCARPFRRPIRHAAIHAVIHTAGCAVRGKDGARLGCFYAFSIDSRACTALKPALPKRTRGSQQCFSEGKYCIAPPPRGQKHRSGPSCWPAAWPVVSPPGWR